MKRKDKKCLNCGIDCRYKYCSNQCQAIVRQTKIIEKWIIDPNSVVEKSGLCHRTIKDFLRELFDNKCQLCKWSEINPTTGIVPLEINHVDGDGFNNHLNNLQLICPNCHSLTHNFKALNKGSKRIRK